MVQIELSFSHFEFSLDPLPDPMDRSKCAHSPAVILSEAKNLSSLCVSAQPAVCEGRTFSRMSSQPQLVQQERRFYFNGRTDRRVIFSVLADSLDEARQKFRASGRPDTDALFIIKTETEIYLA
jgi:hypothetical protein